MAVPREELEATMKPMVEEGKIRTRRFGDSVYYEVSKSPSFQKFLQRSLK
jgi:hypothetical protein